MIIRMRDSKCRLGSYFQELRLLLGCPYLSPDLFEDSPNDLGMAREQDSGKLPN